MSGMVDAVALGWALAALLFLLALWQPAAGLGRRHRHAAMAGALILAGAALYGADIMNLPEMVGVLVIGAALGLLAARELPMRVLPALLAGLAGAIGVAMACLALAIRHNPYAFGLLGEDAASIAPWRVGALAVALAGGVMAAGAGVAWPARRDGGVVGVVLAGLLALLAGGAFA
ncbi:MAG TPA: NADP transhydrogenase subunit beta, partial [Sphingobium sp.]|nr:NADP transhydrogenase subunit beta [Sphingobium sp.]